MLNAENATILFELAADLLQNKSSYLTLKSAVNNSEKIGLSVAATTLDQSGQIVYNVYERKHPNKAHASLEIKQKNTRYLVEVNPSDQDRMKMRRGIDNYATTAYDGEKHRIYSTFHENNVDHDNGDLAAIVLFETVVAQELAKPDTSSQVSLPQIRGSVKGIKPGLFLNIIGNERQSASFTKKEIKHALNLFELFKFNAVLSGSDLPRE